MHLLLQRYESSLLLGIAYSNAGVINEEISGAEISFNNANTLRARDAARFRLAVLLFTRGGDERNELDLRQTVEHLSALLDSYDESSIKEHDRVTSASLILLIRAVTHFFLSHFDEAIADFDNVKDMASRLGVSIDQAFRWIYQGMVKIGCDSGTGDIARTDNPFRVLEGCWNRGLIPVEDFPFPITKYDSR